MTKKAQSILRLFRMLYEIGILSYQAYARLGQKLFYVRRSIDNGTYPKLR